MAELFFYHEFNTNSTGNDSCNSTGLSHTEKNLLLYILGGGGVFATLICVIALFITCYYRLYRRFAHRLVTYQLLSAIILSLVCSAEFSFLNYDYNNSSMIKIVCGAVGFLLSVTIGIKFLITFWLTFYLFMFAVFSKDLRHLELLYVITSIGIPLLFDWIPFVNGLYGVAGAWCWIRNWKGGCPEHEIMLGTIEQYVFLYAPGTVLFLVDLLMIIVTIGVLLYRSYCRPVKEAAEYDPLLERQVEKQKKAFKEILPLMLYPIIFMILFLPSLIQRIYGAIVPEKKRYYLLVLQALTAPSWGLFVGVIVMIHVFILKCCSFPLNQKPQAAVSTFNCRIMEDNPVYTVDTVASTDAKTYFSAPRESDTWNVIADNIN